MPSISSSSRPKPSRSWIHLAVDFVQETTAVITKYTHTKANEKRTTLDSIDRVANVSPTGAFIVRDYFSSDLSP